MQDSIFTKIIKGELPCHKIYEDDRVIAFLDIHPKHPGHTLVVPKKQVDLMWDLDDETYAYLWQIAKKTALHMGEVLDSRIAAHVEGIDAPHAHIHLFPFRTAEDLHKVQDMSSEPDHDALAAMAHKLAMPGN